jgi:hypothetical protein
MEHRKANHIAWFPQGSDAQILASLIDLCNAMAEATGYPTRRRRLERWAGC